MIYLTIAFVGLMILIGGERGFKSFIALCLNILVLSILLALISGSSNPLLVTFFASLLISIIILFYQNGKNAKTIASFFAIIIVVLIMLSITFFLCYKAKLGGLSEIIQGDAMSFGISKNMNINMFQIAIAMIITGLMGAAIDTSITISSAVYEVYRNNPLLNKKELYQSGIHMGNDILGTTINTLYFAYIGGSMSLLILFKMFHYSILEVINSKAFLQETIYIIVSGISCVLIIPITAATISYIIINHEKYQGHLKDDELFQKKPAD
jgi:uncharacterized membrane protein